MQRDVFHVLKQKIAHNNVLLYVILLFFIMMALAPFAPRIFWHPNNVLKIDSVPASGSTSTQVLDLPSPKHPYQLVIPSIGVDMEIIFGDDMDAAWKKGTWHIPGSGTPDSPNGYKNIVLSAHRFLYTSGPQTFYFLDTLKAGDDIYVYWDNSPYHFVVDSQKIVQPNEVEILADTPEQILTLFTCHPVWSTKQRLVITAHPYVQ